MTTQEKLTKAKLNLLQLGDYLGNVSEACRTLGYSRDTFYRLKKRYAEAGLEGLREISRRKPNTRNRVSEEILTCPPQLGPMLISGIGPRRDSRGKAETPQC